MKKPITILLNLKNIFRFKKKAREKYCSYAKFKILFHNLIFVCTQ